MINFTFNKYMHMDFSNTIRIWVKGSSTPDKKGKAGIVIVDPIGSQKTLTVDHYEETHNGMELVAIAHALRELRAHQHVSIFTNSEYALKAIRRYNDLRDLDGLANVNLIKKIMSEASRHETVNIEFVSKNETCTHSILAAKLVGKKI